VELDNEIVFPVPFWLLVEEPDEYIARAIFQAEEKLGAEHCYRWLTPMEGVA
jgi:hypothetical protein